MKVSRLRKGLVFAIAASALGLGCELIVDFDRTKIPVEGTDSAVDTDGATDATTDTTVADTSTGTDAADAATDSSKLDSGAEADAPDGD